MKPTPITGVFEGGGIRGIALAGAAAAALDAGYVFEHVVGTSAGALVGSLVAAGYGGDELEQVICGVDWPGLLDSVPGARLPLIGKNLAMVLHNGLNKGTEMESVWGRLLSDRGIHTFSDLRPGQLAVVATDLNHTRAVSLPEDLARFGIHPGSFSVARAVRMSASVPFLFKPAELTDHTSGEKILIADGAMAANFPIGLAPSGLPTFGFRLLTEDKYHPHEDIGGPASLAKAVMLSGIRARYDLPRTAIEAATIIEVPVASDLDFSITGDEAKETFNIGRRAAAAQFSSLSRKQVPNPA